jgi:AcrR family transcriptional regulator
MGTKERREREKEGTRQRIMDAARGLFVELGYEAVSMRKIAEAIEYSPAAVYVHFKDKEDLIRELCRADFGRLNEEAARLLDVADPVERIRLIGHRYVEFGIEHPHHYKLMFMTPHPVQPDEEDLASKDDPSRNAYALLRQAVRDAVGQGRLRPEYGDVDVVAQMLWAGVHGVTSLKIAMKDDPMVCFHDFAGLTTLMIETTLRGMLRSEGGGL